MFIALLPCKNIGAFVFVLFPPMYISLLNLNITDCLELQVKIFMRKLLRMP